MRLLTSNWPTQSDLFSEMDRLFGNFVSTPSNSSYDDRDFSPAAEVSESEEKFLMSIDLPGIKKEDIKIEIDQNVLKISGERKREAEAKENTKVHFYEKRYGVFKKSFTLPRSVDGAKIEARFENGVLEIQIPKTEVSKPRQIEILS
ncbi:Hsp20/alpha crystallin family protein [Bdellovibrio sp. HCB337]|uniref:Hsp20/alpha crystallin family protein n=1 Tax=Bdellovibrio sp. HCB337 TaxID=3394358 RepID=UPI0039A6A4CF